MRADMAAQLEGNSNTEDDNSKSIEFGAQGAKSTPTERNKRTTLKLRTGLLYIDIIRLPMGRSVVQRRDVFQARLCTNMVSRMQIREQWWRENSRLDSGYGDVK